MKFTGGITVFAAATLWAQAPNPQLSAPAVNTLCVRTAQLMEAGGVAIPDLRQAATPIIVNFKQACSELQLRPATGPPTYAVVQNLHTYLEIADAVPKPFPFPDVARDQLREVRDAFTRFDAHFRALLDQKDADLRAPDRDGTLRFSEENRLLPASRGRRVVFLGDSITAQWRLNQYFPNEDFLNRAINLQLSAQLLAHMKPDVIDVKANAVVLGAGTYDVNREVPLPLIQNSFERLADIAEANSIKVLVPSVLPVNDYLKSENPTYERTPTRPPARIVELNEWLKKFCAQHKFTYIDYYSVLVDPQGALMADASDDGLHPNSKGYRLMAPVLAKAIDQTLKPAAPAPAAPVKPAKKK
jgi:lysophospholipase L1-like esterase